MPWSEQSPIRVLLGSHARQRVRVSQTLLAMPALLLLHGLLAMQWLEGRLPGATLAWFVGVSLAGSLAFYGLVRSGLGDRLSREPSLSTPQMVFAMGCVAWAYALAGSLRSAVLCLMPLILCFGIFALDAPVARRLANFGIVGLGAEMAWLAWHDPTRFDASQEAAHWVFVAMSMAMIRVLSARLGAMRAKLTAQKVELGAALERIRLLATRDALTGLLNRRAAHDELQSAVGLAERGARSLVVALADMDHFKQVNDSYGHQAGDRVLQAFARVAERELRGADRVARWGGEEFLFVLPDTDEPQAVRCLDRLRAAFAAEPVDGIPAGHRLGFSAGVTRCLGSSDLDAAIERADRAMYDAKLAGRGRTCQPRDDAARPAADARAGTLSLAWTADGVARAPRTGS